MYILPPGHWVQAIHWKGVSLLGVCISNFGLAGPLLVNIDPHKDFIALSAQLSHWSSNLLTQIYSVYYYFFTHSGGLSVTFSGTDLQAVQSPLLLLHVICEGSSTPIDTYKKVCDCLCSSTLLFIHLFWTYPCCLLLQVGLNNLAEWHISIVGKFQSMGR